MSQVNDVCPCVRDECLSAPAAPPSSFTFTAPYATANVPLTAVRTRSHKAECVRYGRTKSASEDVVHTLFSSFFHRSVTQQKAEEPKTHVSSSLTFAHANLSRPHG